MALPSSFDPETGTLGRVGNTVRNFAPRTAPRASTYSAPSSSSSGFRNFWDKVNYGVASIGDWLQDSGAYWIALVVAGLPALGGIISLLIWVVNVFMDEGAFWGILSIFGALIAAGIGYYVIVIIFAIAYFLTILLGYVFYNAYTLLIAIVLSAMFIVTPVLVNSSRNSRDSKASTESVTTSYTVQYCTANVLNVRSGPSKSNRVIGTLRKGDSVKVYSTQNGFSKISWNGSYGYVSSTYLSDTRK